MPTIAVYAIAKNEAKHVDRFFESIRDADCVVVLDTGSMDETVEKLMEPKTMNRLARTVVSEAHLQPWRFDVARNMALALVPKDIEWCLVMDLDEVMAPGWRVQFEDAVREHPNAQILQYTLVSSHREDGSPASVLPRILCHRRENFVWRGVVHEGLYWCGQPGKYVVGKCAMETHHWPDAEKARTEYLPLLEMDHRERPENERTTFYLGREYWYRGKRRQAIDTLVAFLKMPTSVWHAERAEALRILASLHEGDDRVKYLLRAVAEDPYRRDQWVDLMDAYRAAGYPEGVIYAGRQAQALNQRPCHYMSFAHAWDEPHIQQAMEWARCALSVTPPLSGPG